MGIGDALKVGIVLLCFGHGSCLQLFEILGLEFLYGCIWLILPLEDIRLPFKQLLDHIVFGLGLCLAYICKHAFDFLLICLGCDSHNVTCGSYDVDILGRDGVDHLIAEIVELFI